MRKLKKNLITLSAVSVIATAGMFAAETEAPAPEPKAETPASPTPAELIATRCLICHGNPVAGKRLAPPFRMVKMHYDTLDEEAFVKTVTAWVKQPDKAKSRMPGAVRNFGVMPALGYPEAEITAIARHLYHSDFAMPGGGGGPGRGRQAAEKTPAAQPGAGCQDACGPDEDKSPATSQDKEDTSKSKGKTGDCAPATPACEEPVPPAAPTSGQESAPPAPDH